MIEFHLFKYYFVVKNIKSLDMPTNQSQIELGIHCGTADKNVLSTGGWKSPPKWLSFPERAMPIRLDNA